MSRSHTHTLTLTLKHTNKIVRFFSFVLLLFCALFILCLSFPTHLHTVTVCLSPHPSVSPPVYLQTCLSPNVLTHACARTHTCAHTHVHTHTHTHTLTLSLSLTLSHTHLLMAPSTDATQGKKHSCVQREWYSSFSVCVCICSQLLFIIFISSILLPKSIFHLPSPSTPPSLSLSSSRALSLSLSCYLHISLLLTLSLPPSLSRSPSLYLSLYLSHSLCRSLSSLPPLLPFSLSLSLSLSLCVFVWESDGVQAEVVFLGHVGSV